MNKKVFFDLYRSELDKDGILTKREVTALDDFLDLYIKDKEELTLKQWAYVFATAFHETAHTFEPVREAYWLSENWRRKNLRYYPYYGRGFVQLTWLSNYKKYSKILNKELVLNPDLAMETATSFKILVHGMKNGTFTGVRLDRYINDKVADYTLARYVVNGSDRRDLIAGYARKFEFILEEAHKSC